jgi:hypothetical protein
MKLTTVIEAYITLQQSLGLRSKTARRTLRRFGRQMGDVHIDDIQAEQVLDFLQGSGPLSSTWRTKYRLLFGLYRFAISRGYVATSPLPPNLPKFPPQQTPYIYSTIVAACFPCQMARIHVSLRLVLERAGTIRVSSRCFNAFGTLLALDVRRGNCVRQECMTSDTRQQSTG